MHRIISWIFTIPYIPLFFGILCAFHPLQCLAICFGYRAHKLVLDLMNATLILNFKTVGTRFHIHRECDLKPNTSYIFVSNHQSMYDIPFLIWVLRANHPKFIAKRELGRWIPSISFALRHMGSVLIDRGDRQQAVQAIREFGAQCATRHFSAVIFPEGTRAREGAMKQFKGAGLLTLMQVMPDAEIVPIVIDGSWELVRYNLLPVPFGRTVSLTILEPLFRSDFEPKQLVSKCEQVISERLTAQRLDSVKQEH